MAFPPPCGAAPFVTKNHRSSRDLAAPRHAPVSLRTTAASIAATRDLNGFSDSLVRLALGGANTFTGTGSFDGAHTLNGTYAPRNSRSIQTIGSQTWNSGASDH